MMKWPITGKPVAFERACIAPYVVAPPPRSAGLRVVVAPSLARACALSVLTVYQLQATRTFSRFAVTSITPRENR
jgi:hypothetical protein